MELLSPEQAAKELRLTPRRVRQFCKQGRIGQRVGGRYVITRRELNAFLSAPRPTGRPQKEKSE